MEYQKTIAEENALKKMTNTQEQKWREDFEVEFEIYEKSIEYNREHGEYSHFSDNECWGGYLAARKKAQEEIDSVYKLYAKKRKDDNDFMDRVIADYENKIQFLTQQLEEKDHEVRVQQTYNSRLVSENEQLTQQLKEVSDSSKEFYDGLVNYREQNKHLKQLIERAILFINGDYHNSLRKNERKKWLEEARLIVGDKK